MKRVICLVLVMVMFSIAGFANIADPNLSKNKSKPAKTIDTELRINLDSNATEARLIIPRSQLKQLRAELEQMDDDSDNTAAVVSPRSFTRTQTIVSGMFLSLAVVFGGLWFVRSGKAETRGAKSLVILAVIAGAVSAATFAYANAGPPPEARSITSKMFSQSVHMYGFGWGKIKLEIGDQDRPTLIVPNPKTSTPGEE